ncbi:MAG: discoidin domain-containing protein, partial [Pseudomonadota bacterium]
WKATPDGQRLVTTHGAKKIKCNFIKTVNAGASASHLAWSESLGRILISRFISPFVQGESGASPNINGAGGKVTVINDGNYSVVSSVNLQHSNRLDSEHTGRGIPNYLGAPALSPDGLSAWVPSKQDNILRGSARDGQALTHDLSVRAVASIIEFPAITENYNRRVDLDNASVASAAAFGPWGNYLFVALEGNRTIAVIDAWGNDELFRFNVGRAPQGLALSSDGTRLYVHNFMDRSIGVHDLSDLIDHGILSISEVDTVFTVGTENLAADTFSGKQLFYDARDRRLAQERYMSCASCHREGGHDGRTWDFTQFGEGFRNTITLQGHGEGHGRLHWSANFDEVHDFEGQIRDFAGGTGLMSDAAFNTGTRSQPLGDPKAGLSTDLDDLAAYVTSLIDSGGSPFSNNANSNQALLGYTVFQEQNCASCHSGVNFTDSESGLKHDVGTASGDTGLNGGVDTPTLLGLWATAPYLHNGSQATLAGAINAHNGHNITEPDLSNLVTYLNTLQTGSENNHALGGAVSQSSTLFGAVANVAIDGVTDGNGNVTHTDFDNEAWWQIDLGSVVDIDRIVLWNRTDCCTSRLANFDVLVSDAPFASFDNAATRAQSGVSTYHSAGQAGVQHTVSVDRSARYVRVQLRNQQILSLAQIGDCRQKKTRTWTKFSNLQRII